jgi:predicted Rossmann fold nucleotide-binding protein DprA/Smf involved in DNA uptake
VDSPASEGSHELIKCGGAALATSPADVLALLETPARHHFHGTHEARYADPRADSAPALWSEAEASEADPLHRLVVEALDRARSPDELASMLGVEPGELRAALTVLEIRGMVRRRGTLIERRG